MSFPPSPLEHFESTLSHFEQARDWVENALATLAESEMRKLAKRFPTRRIELHSGMGTTQIRISKRHPLATFDDWGYFGELATAACDWPEAITRPAPTLWDAIETYQDNVSEGKDPGLGTIIYENGKRIKGLPQGGKSD